VDEREHPGREDLVGEDDETGDESEGERQEALASLWRPIASRGSWRRLERRRATPRKVEGRASERDARSGRGGKAPRRSEERE
jgi:hypothetical protein